METFWMLVTVVSGVIAIPCTATAIYRLASRIWRDWKNLERDMKRVCDEVKREHPGLKKPQAAQLGYYRQEVLCCHTKYHRFCSTCGMKVPPEPQKMPKAEMKYTVTWSGFKVDDRGPQ